MAEEHAQLSQARGLSALRGSGDTRDVGSPKASREKTSEPGRQAAPATHDRRARPRCHGPSVATCAYAHLSSDFLCLSPAAMPACVRLRRRRPIVRLCSAAFSRRRRVRACSRGPRLRQDGVRIARWLGSDSDVECSKYHDASFRDTCSTEAASRSPGETSCGPRPALPAWAPARRTWAWRCEHVEQPSARVAAEGAPSHRRVRAYSTRRLLAHPNAYGLRAGRIAM